MGIRYRLAQGVAAVSSWGLRHVFHRPAANFPGKVALYIDPRLVADLRGRVDESVCVVGTNGKTTVVNLLADALEAAGYTVACNRTGANLDSGITTALLYAHHAQWGVFECDELWLAHVLPGLQSRYVLLLNLFRDQLDRVGEIVHIQDSIVEAIASSPDTVLVYNADDPHCQAIAERVANEKIPFGIAEDLGLPQNTVADARMCQRCAAMLEYDWRQYGQLGSYRCQSCGFSRCEPVYAAVDVRLSGGGSAFKVNKKGQSLDIRFSTRFTGAYMVYNLLAVAVAADLVDVPYEALRRAIRSFNPHNGRLERYDIGGRDVLLNLAKNPTGFNQNLDIVLAGDGPKAVAFYINDKEADGHDVSWLWDIDFQNLAEAARAGDLMVCAGGIRRNDMQVRLKYAGIRAGLVDGVDDFLERVPFGAHAYVIANYTALPAVKSTLDQLEREGCVAVREIERMKLPFPFMPPDCEREELSSTPGITIMTLYPTLLNLYGDGGNVAVLAARARWRGIGVDIVQVDVGDTPDFGAADIVYLGGGPDREQRLASECLAAHADALRAYVEDGGVVLAICGGFQILGNEWLMGEETVSGLGILGVTTKRAEGGSRNRIVGNVVLSSALAPTMPVVGYENHAGRTFLDSSVEPFGLVSGVRGCGNNDVDGADGALYRNVVGTYLHGPLLAKNPEIADELLRRALARRGSVAPLPVLDDEEERAANAFFCAMA